MSQQILKADIAQKLETKDLRFAMLVKMGQQAKIRLYNRQKVKQLKINEKVKQILKKNQAYCLTREERYLLEIEKKIFCFCKQKKQGKTLLCDGCNNQYHIQCLDLTIEQANNLQGYICPQCEQREKKSQKQQQLAQKVKQEESEKQQVNSKKEEDLQTQETKSELDLDELNEKKRKKSQEKQIVNTKVHHNGNGTTKQVKQPEENIKKKIKRNQEIPENKIVKKQKVIKQSNQYIPFQQAVAYNYPTFTNCNVNPYDQNLYLGQIPFYFNQNNDAINMSLQDQYLQNYQPFYSFQQQ